MPCQITPAQHAAAVSRLYLAAPNGRHFCKLGESQADAIKRLRRSHGAQGRGGVSRAYPTFKPGMSTAEYVRKYEELNSETKNGRAGPFPYFAELNSQPATLYAGGALDFGPEFEELADDAAPDVAPIDAPIDAPAIVADAPEAAAPAEPEAAPVVAQDAAPAEPASEAAPAYTLPADTYKDWHACESRAFVPNARQSIVMAAVSAALASGLYYTANVRKHCMATLAPSADDVARGLNRVEGGEFGMDCYYARKTLDAQKKHAAEDAASASLALSVGDVIGSLVFNDYKLVRAAVVSAVSADGLTVTIDAKRGASVVRFEGAPLSVQYAIDRAHEKGKRKENASDWSAMRAEWRRQAAESAAVFAAAGIPAPDAPGLPDAIADTAKPDPAAELAPNPAGPDAEPVKRKPRQPKPADTAPAEKAAPRRMADALAILAAAVAPRAAPIDAAPSVADPAPVDPAPAEPGRAFAMHWPAKPAEPRQPATDAPTAEPAPAWPECPDPVRPADPGADPDHAPQPAGIPLDDIGAACASPAGNPQRKPADAPNWRGRAALGAILAGHRRRGGNSPGDIGKAGAARAGQTQGKPARIDAPAWCGRLILGADSAGHPTRPGFPCGDIGKHSAPSMPQTQGMAGKPWPDAPGWQSARLLANAAAPSGWPGMTAGNRGQTATPHQIGAAGPGLVRSWQPSARRGESHVTTSAQIQAGQAIRTRRAGVGIRPMPLGQRGAILAGWLATHAPPVATSARTTAAQRWPPWRDSAHSHRTPARPL